MNHQCGFTDEELMKLLPFLRMLALKRTLNMDNANELLQATVERMLQRKHQFQGGELGAWGAVVMRSLHIRAWRVSRREHPAGIDFEEEIESDEDIERDYANREQLKAVFAVIATMPSDMRKALTYATIDGLEYWQVARMMRVKLGTVKSRISRARAIINERLPEYA